MPGSLVSLIGMARMSQVWCSVAAHRLRGKANCSSAGVDLQLSSTPKTDTAEPYEVLSTHPVEDMNPI